jgi:hypothetical protein
MVTLVSPALEKYFKSLPPEKEQEARRQFEAFALGILQNLKGKALRATADKFLKMVKPGERAAFKMITDKVRSVSSSQRFDAQMAVAFSFAFECGIRYAVEAKGRGEDPLKVITDIHTTTLSETANDFIKGNR